MLFTCNSLIVTQSCPRCRKPHNDDMRIIVTASVVIPKRKAAARKTKSAAKDKNDVSEDTNQEDISDVEEIDDEAELIEGRGRNAFQNSESSADEELSRLGSAGSPVRVPIFSNYTYGVQIDFIKF